MTFSYCAACGREEEVDGSLKTCTACKLVKYCGVGCQKAHRPLHKEECNIRAAELKLLDDEVVPKQKQQPPLKRKYCNNDAESEATPQIHQTESRSHIFSLTPEIFGRVATYLEIFGDLSNLVISLACASLRNSAYKMYVDAIHGAVLREEAYLDQLFSHLPTGRWYFELNDAPQYLAVASKIRLWMSVNENWSDRVVTAISCQSWSVESCGLVRRVKVSGGAAASMKLDAVHIGEIICHQLLPETGVPGLEDEYGNILLAVDGENMMRSSPDYLHDELKEIKEDQAVHLYFINRSHILFNHPKVVISLGLVEVLKEMLNKGYVQANDSLNRRNERPLLWSTYTESVDDSCFKFMLSLPGIECGDFLMYVSQMDLLLGLDAYRAIARHPTTDVNATDEAIFYSNTAIRFVLDKCGELENNGDDIVGQIKVLLGLGADPNLRRTTWNTLEYLMHKSAEAHDRHESTDEEWRQQILIHDRHFEELYAVLRKALRARPARA